MAALDLDPISIASRKVDGICPLGNDPFYPSAAGLREHNFAMPRYMVAIPNQSRRGPWKNCRQRLFAFEKSDSSCVISVEIQQIEYIVDKVRFRSRIERILQSLKAYAAVWFQRDDFAVQPCSLDWQCRRRLGNPLEFICPIEAGSCDERC